MRNVADKTCTNNQNIFFSFNFFFSESRAVYKLMWKDMVELDRS